MSGKTRCSTTSEQGTQPSVERFTPGPWDYRPGGYDDWGWIRGGPGGMTIGHAHGPLEDDEANRHRTAKTDPWEHNARLMAAAPQLYDALKDALAGLRYIRQHYHDERTATGDLYGVGFDLVEEKAKTALAKAVPQTIAGRPDEQSNTDSSPNPIAAPTEESDG